MRQNHTDPKTGELLLRNESNWFFGTLVAWALLALAALFFNGSALHGADASPDSELLRDCIFMFGASVAMRLMLGRPLVAIRGEVARVRNPLREYRIRLTAFEHMKEGLLGIPAIRVGDKQIRLFGLQESVMSSSRGGSNLRHLLDVVVKEAIADESVQQFKVVTELARNGSSILLAEWRVDAWTVLLLFGWSIFAASFLLPWR